MERGRKLLGGEAHDGQRMGRDDSRVLEQTPKIVELASSKEWKTEWPSNFDAQWLKLLEGECSSLLATLEDRGVLLLVAQAREEEVLIELRMA